MCPKLANLTNGEVTVAYNGANGSCRYGGVATYSCEYGYKLKGDKRRTCSYGVWSGSEPCCEKCKDQIVHVIVVCSHMIFSCHNCSVSQAWQSRKW